MYLIIRKFFLLIKSLIFNKITVLNTSIEIFLCLQMTADKKQNMIFLVINQINLLVIKFILKKYHFFHNFLLEFKLRKIYAKT